MKTKTVEVELTNYFVKCVLDIVISNGIKEEPNEIYTHFNLDAEDGEPSHETVFEMCEFEQIAKVYFSDKEKTVRVLSGYYEVWEEYDNVADEEIKTYEFTEEELKRIQDTINNQ